MYGGAAMDGFVSLSAKRAEIKGSYDVIVCGAGIAGIAAALSAKRAGAKRVLLLEREYAPGGLATLGLVTIYLPLCDGRGHQVSFGIAQELLRLSVSKGAEQPIPACWVAPAGPDQRRGERYRCRFNAGLFTCLAERLLVDSGVEILYGATVFDALREGKRLKALLCLQAEGLAAYEANGFVDASGDAALFACAGEETALYPLGNRQAAWYYSCENGKNAFHTIGSAPQPGERVEGGVCGLTSREKTGLMLEARRLILQDFLSRGGLTEEHAISTLPQIPQLRMTRRIVGKNCMRLEDAFVSQSDSVGMFSNWRVSGPVYELPLGALRGEAENLFAAGRVLSADDKMWDIARAIPCCAVSGEAAGLAAALDGDVPKVQAALRARDIPLHWDEIGIGEEDSVTPPKA